MTTQTALSIAFPLLSIIGFLFSVYMSYKLFCKTSKRMLKMVNDLGVYGWLAFAIVAYGIMVDPKVLVIVALLHYGKTRPNRKSNKFNPFK